MGLNLAACSTLFSSDNSGATRDGKVTSASTTTGTATASGEAVGGNISRSMDEADKSKLWHALDKPLGKSTQWVNTNTGTSYTVIPTEKLSINGNPYCRRYSVTSTRGGNTHEINGTACVSATSNWEAVNG